MDADARALGRGYAPVRPGRRASHADEAQPAPPPEESDEALVARITLCDFDALRLLHDRYAGQAFAVAYRVVSNREAAEEVTQDTFVSVWRHARTYNPAVGPVRPWLTSIAQNRAVDRLRRASARQRNVSLNEAWMAASRTDIFADAYANVQRDQVRASLAKLPDEQRLAIQGVYYQGNTFAEVADVMGVPTGTVKSRVRLGLVKLQRLLAPMR